MGPIAPDQVQAALLAFVDRDVYLHLETTNGSYAALQSKTMAIVAFVRNAKVRFHRATVAGTGPYRVGLEMEHGWTYAEGLTDFEVDGQGRLLLAGHDPDGRLAIALQLSPAPFPS